MSNVKETQLLQQILERWITKKTNLVIFTQKIAKKIDEYGLVCETSLPFQLVPTEFMDADGDVVCKIFTNMDHPMYGFFSIEIQDDRCIVTAPSIYETELLVLTHEECENWIDTLGSDMDSFYQLSSAAEENQTVFCELFINDLLIVYHQLIKQYLHDVKLEISRNPLVALTAGGSYSFLKDIKNNYNRALLIPSAWVVFKSEDNLPDEGEILDEYLDSEGTEQLSMRLNQFFRKENYLAAPVYLAQRICLQAGMKVQGTSIADKCEMNASRTEQLGEFLLPPLDISEFKLELGN